MESDMDVPSNNTTFNGCIKKPSKPRKKTPSRAKAINQHCKDCIYDPSNGTGAWRQQVEACTVTSCALYLVRPMSSKRSDEDEEDTE